VQYERVQCAYGIIYQTLHFFSHSSYDGRRRLLSSFNGSTARVEQAIRLIETCLFLMKINDCQYNVQLIDGPDSSVTRLYYESFDKNFLARSTISSLNILHDSPSVIVKYICIYIIHTHTRARVYVLRLYISSMPSIRCL